MIVNKEFSEELSSFSKEIAEVAIDNFIKGMEYERTRKRPNKYKVEEVEEADDFYRSHKPRLRG